MAKLTLQDIITGYGGAALYNSNNALIEAALENTLSRDGTAPNTMSADIDLNTNDLLNAGTVNCTELIANGVSLVAQVAAAAASAAAAAVSETNAATSETNASTSETNASASATLASQWASLTGALVAATDYSAKEYAIGTTVAAGSAKDWATITGSLVDGAEYSAKEYATGTTVASGSSKQWATEAEDVLVNATEYSAYHWAQKAMAASGGETVKVSSNDTTADYLVNKFTALHGLTWTEINDGGNEDLQISVGSHLEIGGGANNHKLNIYESTSGANYAHFTNLTTGNTTGDGFLVGIGTAETADLWNYENTDMKFATNNAEAMRIKAGGQVAIGADLSNSKVNIHDASSGAVQVQFTNTTTGTTSSDGLAIGLGAGEDARFINYENTNMLFYTNSAVRLQIAADGGVYTNGATGGSQGVDTINAGELFVDGRSISGSTPTTSNKYKRTSAKFVVDYGFDTTGVIAAINVGSAWTKNTWESFGPTGSGATNIVADLDVVNDMGACSAYEFSCQFSGLANTAAAYNQYIEYTMDAAHAAQAYVGRHGSYNGSGGSAAISAMGMGGTFSANDTGVGEIRWNSTNCTSESIYLIVHAIHEGEGN